MNLYRLIVLREDKENLERGVWADRMVGLYPARYTVITSVETKEEFDKRKGTI